MLVTTSDYTHNDQSQLVSQHKVQQNEIANSVHYDKTDKHTPATTGRLWLYGTTIVNIVTLFLVAVAYERKTKSAINQATLDFSVNHGMTITNQYYC